MKNVKRWVLLLCAVISFSVTLNDYQVASSQKQKLNGPILVSDGRNDNYIFQDVGTGRVWEVKQPVSSAQVDLVSWSPNGCHILLRTFHRPLYDHLYHILSVESSLRREVSSSLLGGIRRDNYGAIWSLDGRSVTFGVSFGKTGSRIYSVDIQRFTSSLVLSVEGSILGPVRWLSDHELLYGSYEYRTRNYRFRAIWDTKTKTSRTIPEGPQLPAIDSIVYNGPASPNGEMLAAFYNLPEYRYLKSGMTGYPDDRTPEEIDDVENTPKVSGFDIYYLDKRPKQHIDTYGQFLQFLAWSPSSEQIVVSTDPDSSRAELNGIYVYSVKTGTLRRVGKYPSLRRGEIGPPGITWSPDSQWLAFITPTGYIIYNLAEAREIRLSERFEGYLMLPEWSPVMDYRNTTCAW